jgi:hypothetical protein
MKLRAVLRARCSARVLVLVLILPLVLLASASYAHKYAARSSAWTRLFPFGATASVFKISGRVADAGGNVLGGLSLSLNGSANAITDASGNYSFTNLAAAGNYTVTPSSSNYSFSPANRTFNNLNVDRIANFVGTQTIVSIAGKITDSNNVGVGGVGVVLTGFGPAGLNTVTDGLGNYSFGNLAAGGNYLVMPAGSFTPSSQTFNNLTVNATANFKAAPNIPPQCNTPSFAPATNFAAPAPTFVAEGDFNGDGKLDLAVAVGNSNNVSILLGTGTGSFTPAGNFGVGALPRSIAVGDFNGDGRLDLAVANAGSNNVSILLGAAAGGFSTATNVDVGSSPFSVAVGDFNGDGKLDLAVANSGSNTVSILLGTGTGAFSAPTNFAVGSSPFSVAVGDFNGDGALDLAVANNNSGNVSILLGNGKGSFNAATNFAAGVAPFSVAVGDFNGDGKLDLAVGSNGGSNNISILLGTGTGSFSAPTPFAAGPIPRAVAVGDFNGDGKLDLAVANGNSNNVSILLGTGTGSFNTATNFAVDSNPVSVAVGDLNGDGKVDLVTANSNSNDVSILLNGSAICDTQTSLTISGQITDPSNKPLSGVAVTLSGPISRVVQTNAGGNYAFPGLVPGGNYTVTVQTPYFVMTPSRADFFNSSSSQVFNLVSAPVAVPAATPSLNDDFSSPTRDPNKWTLGTLTLPPGATDPQVNVSQINSQLVITPLTRATGKHYNGYVSANSIDMRNGSASVKLVKAATGGADTIFAIGTDSNNFFRFRVGLPGSATGPPMIESPDAVEGPLDTSQLFFEVKIAGVLTSVPITYDPTKPLFMRFRLDFSTNSIVFETSQDGSTYTPQLTQSLTLSVSALQVELSAGSSQPADPPGSAVFQQFNVVTSTFQFSTAGYAANEGDVSVQITVTRAGILTNTASVDFATADGTALQRTDYTIAAGTLTFAPGDTSKTLVILVEDDLYPEGSTNLNLLLSNPVGAGLNSPGRAVLTVADSDTTQPTTNPLDNSDAQFFVTQHYYDFLSRVPDPGGFAFWTQQITGNSSNSPAPCAPGDSACLLSRRITVSNAFFFELEYQQTAAYVYRLYRAAYGNNQPFPNPDATNPAVPAAQQTEAKKIPDYAVFANDRARLIGSANLAQDQLALANLFVSRPEFAKYPSSLTLAQFVDAVLANIKTDNGVDLTSQRNALIALGSPGAVMYRLANDDAQTGNGGINNRAFIDAEYNRAFVASQYFGYLRRDGDIGGLLFWLGQVSSAPLRDVTKQHAMVCSFITSAEYQQRFSSVVSHTNAECSP